MGRNINNKRSVIFSRLKGFLYVFFGIGALGFGIINTRNIDTQKTDVSVLLILAFLGGILFFYGCRGLLKSLHR